MKRMPNEVPDFSLITGQSTEGLYTFAQKEKSLVLCVVAISQDFQFSYSVMRNGSNPASLPIIFFKKKNKAVHVTFNS